MIATGEHPSGWLIAVVGGGGVSSAVGDAVLAWLAGVLWHDGSKLVQVRVKEIGEKEFKV